MKFDTGSITSILEQALSLDGLVYIFGKICLVASVGFALSMGENIGSPDLNLSSSEFESVASGDGKSIEKPLSAYSLIGRRNIFGRSVSKGGKTQNKPSATTLDIRLVATNVSSSAISFAIVEDKKKRSQDVFEIGEMVFDQAKLIEISASSIKIDRNGKIEVLELEDTPLSSSRGSGDSGGIHSLNDEQTSFSVAERELEEALSNLPKLLSQARAVPYFRNGKSIGMRLFAIRRGSLYEKLGMKNGDIITAVNDSSLSDPAQALKLFEQLKSERSIDVELERNGTKTTLDYTID